jgi:hypothetical protein
LTVDDELEPKKLPIDVESEVGMSRRDLLRRSAIVGGALLWAAPTIQTVGMKAAGAQVAGEPSPGTCAACYCWSLKANGRVRKEFGFNDGATAPGLKSFQDCADYCKHQGAYSSTGGSPNGPYANSNWCSGTGDCIVTTGQVNHLPISPNPHCT